MDVCATWVSRVLVSESADQRPLYRCAEIYAREGIELKAQPWPGRWGPAARCSSPSWTPSAIASPPLGRRARDRDEAVQKVKVEQCPRLLDITQMRLLFSESEIRREWFGPLIKSLIAIKTLPLH